jgi:hypothetical protein
MMLFCVPIDHEAMESTDITKESSKAEKKDEKKKKGSSKAMKKMSGLISSIRGSSS